MAAAAAAAAAPKVVCWGALSIAQMAAMRGAAAAACKTGA